MTGDCIGCCSQYGGCGLGADFRDIAVAAVAVLKAGCSKYGDTTTCPLKVFALSAAFMVLVQTSVAIYARGDAISLVPLFNGGAIANTGRFKRPSSLYITNVFATGAVARINAYDDVLLYNLFRK